MCLSLLGIILQTKGLPVWILVRAHVWLGGSDPSWGTCKRQLIDISLPLFFPLSKINKRKTIQKIKQLNIAVWHSSITVPLMGVHLIHLDLFYFTLYFSGNNEGNFYDESKWEYSDEVIYHKMESLKIKEGNVLKICRTVYSVKHLQLPVLCIHAQPTLYAREMQSWSCLSSWRQLCQTTNLIFSKSLLPHLCAFFVH